MRDELILDTPEQIRALAHPLRQRVVGLLTNAPYTNKQLATLLQVTPPRLHFHVHELLEAGLIEIVAERPKGGVVEKYYRAVARVMRVLPSVTERIGNDELNETTLEAVRQEYVRANIYYDGHIPQMQFRYELLRLSPERLERIQGLIRTLEDEMTAALEDPASDTYEQFFAATVLLHQLPPVAVDEDSGDDQESGDKENGEDSGSQADSENSGDK